MLSTKLVSRMNDQITAEFFSSNLYLQMSAWCAWKGYDGCSAFLRRHAQEEQTHMIKLYDYMIETGNLPTLGTIEAPRAEFGSIKEIFEETLAHEVKITAQINSLVELAMEEKDYSTLHFLQWYVGEQHEEETLFRGILDKIEMIGIEGRGLFFIDREIANLNRQIAAQSGKE